MNKILIITPVKDSLDTFERTARAIMATDCAYRWHYRVYDDYSSPDNAARLDALSAELGFELIHLSSLVPTPSPNYRFVLCHAQREALECHAHLVIVESDVVVASDTVSRLIATVGESVAMSAAVTVDDSGNVNFPYLYARKYPLRLISTRKRLSFCCTLLSNGFLSRYPFTSLDPEKNWYDVTITRTARRLGMRTMLDLSNPVRHYPHSSRPWKLLKYTNPLKYYWVKITRGYDKI